MNISKISKKTMTVILIFCLAGASYGVMRSSAKKRSFLQMDNKNTGYMRGLSHRKVEMTGTIGKAMGNKNMGAGKYRILKNKRILKKVTNEQKFATAASNLSKAHVYPNPCKVFEGQTFVTFTNLTLRAEIKIFTIAGELVKKIDKNDGTDEVKWYLKNDAGSRVASGVYIYYIKSGSMKETGKVMIIK